MRSRAAHPLPRNERGFTLIELLVVMIILGIVLALVARIITTTIGSTREAEQSRRTFSMTEQLRSRLEADLRTSISPGRFFNEVSSLDDLRQKLQTGSNANLDSQGIVVDEVIKATPTELQFIADGEAESGATQDLECVTWNYVADGSTWGVTRSLADYAGGCGVASNPQYVIEPMKITSGAAAPSRFFEYVLTCDPAACFGGASLTCKGTAMPAGTSLSAAQMRWVTQVKLNFNGIAAGDASAKTADQASAVALRSRTSDDYRYGLGCSS